MQRLAAIGVTGFIVVHALSVNVRPLVGGSGAGSFFVGPKAVSLATWAGLGIIGAVVLLVRSWPPKDVRARLTRPVNVALGLAIIGFAFAPLMSSTTWVRFGYTGFPSRYDGSLMFLASLAIAVTSALVAYRFARVSRVALSALVGASAVVGGIGLLQSAGVDVWAVLGASFVGRLPPRSTLGNPAFVSVLAAMGFIVTATLGARTWPSAGTVRRAGLAGLLLLFSTSTVATGSRAAMIALGVVGIGAAAWYGMRQRGTLRVGYLLTVVVVGVAGFLVAPLMSSYGSQKIADLGDAVAGGGVSTSIRARALYMRVATRLIASQPIRPYGVAAFTVELWRGADEEQLEWLVRRNVPEEAMASYQRVENVLVYRDPETGQMRQVPVVHDKVHSYLLDMWIAYGPIATLGFVAWLLLVAVRLWRAGTSTSIAVLAAMAVYALWAQAWFPSIALEPLVLIMVGIAWGDAERTLAEETPSRVPA